MSTKLNTDLNAVELTPDELDAIAGGARRRPFRLSWADQIAIARALSRLPIG
jgi:hypothetical protein